MGWRLAVGGSWVEFFSHRPDNPATIGVERWPSAGDTAGYRVRQPKLTPVSLISMVLCGSICRSGAGSRCWRRVWTGIRSRLAHRQLHSPAQVTLSLTLISQQAS